MPRRMFIAFVPADAFAGSYAKDPYKFSHCNVSALATYVDGTQVPEQPFTPDFNADHYLLTYEAMYNALNQNQTDTYCTIDFDDFKKSPLFCIQFSPDLSNGPGEGGSVSPLDHGSLRLLVRFSTPLEESVNMLCYMEYDSFIEVYGNRQVLTSYN